jgi:hypothetical protein
MKGEESAKEEDVLLPVYGMNQRFEKLQGP